MTTSSAPVTAGSTRPVPDVDVLVVGAGITGIYQLHRAREAGFSALLV
jgi:cation diffusion facilitator CzcD-associated flavoprotein CzcO